ncbi:HAMP domain-containing protein [Skermania sp. ID1734]|nr:HAMP domain-containing protein [Skermania sp. ID1734]
MVAVVAVPLIAAIVLGAMQVASEIQQATKLHDAAKYADVISTVAELNGITGIVSGGQLSNTVTDADLAEFDKQLQAARADLNRSGLYPDAKGAISQMIDTAELVRSTGKQPGRGLPETAAVLHRLADETAKTIDLIVGPMSDSAIDKAANRLLEVQGAYRALRDETLAGVQMLLNPKDPGTDVLTQAGGELAMLDNLRRSNPDLTAKIADLQKLTNDRITTLLDARGHNQPLPVDKLRASLLASQAAYTDMTRQAAADISSVIDQRVADARNVAIRDIAIVLAALIIATVLAVLVSRSLLSPLRRLRESALRVSHAELPEEIDRIKAGERLENIQVSPVPVRTTEEIGQVARAVDDMHGQALRLAGEQAQLRLQVNDMFETLSRRNKSLVDHQLNLIESLEQEEKDPTRLDSLFRLDHLAARMRRNNDNLLILAGTKTRQQRNAAVQLGDVVRGAISEVEEYQRVRIGAVPDGLIAGSAVADVVHIIAELLDNALRASPPDSEVGFHYGRAIDGGWIIEIADTGIGIPPAQLDAINTQLREGSTVSAETARRMGLYVVGQLAHRHGISVRLRPTLETARNAGIVASIHLPPQLTVAAPSPAPAPVPQASAEPREPVAPRPPLAPVAAAAPNGVDAVHTGLPQRQPGSALPQRQPGPGLPQREPVSPPPQGEPSPELPQRQPASGLPQRQPGAGLPQGQPGAGLPQRQPAAPAPEPTAIPVAATATEPAAPTRHRGDPAKTASFFTSRLEEAPQPIEDTPIFGEMVSAWLADSDKVDFNVADVWNSRADAGWTAARMATEATVQGRTAAGLPKRQPGSRLVPGSVSSSAAGRQGRRDPDAVRSSLGRHQRGVRTGRADQARRRSTEGER